MTIGDSFTVEEVRRLAGASRAFAEAADDWLALHTRRGDSRRRGTRPTVQPIPGADPTEVAVRAARVQALASAAAMAIDLSGTFVSAPFPPGLNAAREWATMTTKGTVNAEDVTYPYAAHVLDLLAERPARALPMFPLPDPTALHPYAWSSGIVDRWLQELYTEIPFIAAATVHSNWTSRLVTLRPKDPWPRYPQHDSYWIGLLAPKPPVPGEPRLTVPDSGDPEDNARRQAALAAALHGLHRLSDTYHPTKRPASAPPLTHDQVGGWLHSWSVLCRLLDECTVHLPPAMAPGPEPVPAPLPIPPSNPRIVVDDDVFAPVYDPRNPDAQISSREAVTVTTTAPDDTLLHALASAVARIGLVDSEGTEHPDLDTMLEETHDLDTPSWVAVLEDANGRPFLYVDCRGVIPEPMGAALREILRQELARHLPDADARPS